MVMVTALIIPLACFAASPGDINLRLVEGDVQIKTEDTEDWVAAASNMPLLDSDMLWVPDGGRAELQLTGGTVVRLGGGTFLEVTGVSPNGFRCSLGEGHVYANVRGPRAYDVMVLTPGGPFRGHNGAIYRVDVDRDGDVTASVLSGTVYADPGDEEIRISEGQKFVLPGYGGRPELLRTPAADSWERWNRERDRELFDAAYGASGHGYLPDELRPYANELDGNGRWVQTPEYGYVWIPTAVRGDDWAPYRVGRWVRVRGDYAWVSYEPWGWVPHHYGRWAHIRNLGWCWVPPPKGSAQWAPGYVAWVYTPQHVSWVPLAPRETYRGPRYGESHSANPTSVTANGTIGQSPNSHKNVHVRNAVTTIRHDQFPYGKPMPTPTVENRFLKAAKIMAAPVPKGEERRATGPAFKEIPSHNLPPQRVRDIRVGTLRDQYPAYRSFPMGGPIPSKPRKEGAAKEIPPQDGPGGTGRSRIVDRKTGERIEAVPPKDKLGEPRRDGRGTEVKPMPMVPFPNYDRKLDIKPRIAPEREVKAGGNGPSIAAGRPVSVVPTGIENLGPSPRPDRKLLVQSQPVKKPPDVVTVTAREMWPQPSAPPRPDFQALRKADPVREGLLKPAVAPERIDPLQRRVHELSRKRPDMSPSVPEAHGGTNGLAHPGIGTIHKIKEGGPPAEQPKRGREMSVETKPEPKEKPRRPTNPFATVKHDREQGIGEARPNEGPKAGRGARQASFRGNGGRPN